MSAGDNWNVTRLSSATPVSVRLQILEAADEEPGAEEQQEAERDLRGHQSLSQEQRPAGAGDRAHRVLQRRPRIGPARAQRRQQPEDDASQARQAEGERQNSQIRFGTDEERLPVGWDERQQTLRQHERERQAGHAAGERQDQALDEQLAHQPAARRAEREAHGNLLLPHEASSDQQVRHVGARDEEHQADHAHQHDERRREVVAQRRIAHRGAGHEQLALHELIA